MFCMIFYANCKIKLISIKNKLQTTKLNNNHLTETTIIKFLNPNRFCLLI